MAYICFPLVMTSFPVIWVFDVVVGVVSNFFVVVVDLDVVPGVSSTLIFNVQFPV